MNDWWIVVLAVLIPLFGFMLAMRPWIRDTVRAELSGLNERVGKLEVGFNTTNERLASVEARLDAIDSRLVEVILLYRKYPESSNPGPLKDELLLKLENRTITRYEAIQLEQIMEAEERRAREQNDTLKAVLIILILALLASVIAKLTE